MKLEQEIKNDIPVRELPEGKIAIITKWIPIHEGLIVIKWKDTLFVINDPDKYWENTHKWKDEDSRVRVLEKGEKIIV